MNFRTDLVFVIAKNILVLLKNIFVCIQFIFECCFNLIHFADVLISFVRFTDNVLNFPLHFVLSNWFLNLQLLLFLLICCVIYCFHFGECYRYFYCLRFWTEKTYVDKVWLKIYNFVRFWLVAKLFTGCLNSVYCFFNWNKSRIKEFQVTIHLCWITVFEWYKRLKLSPLIKPSDWNF